jgi:hypothetical protein
MALPRLDVFHVHVLVLVLVLGRRRFSLDRRAKLFLDPRWNWPRRGAMLLRGAFQLGCVPTSSRRLRGVINFPLDYVADYGNRFISIILPIMLAAATPRRLRPDLIYRLCKNAL